MAETASGRNPGGERNGSIKKRAYQRSLELFAEKGFENVKVTDICNDIGISVGTFYYYFPSKEAVLLAYSDMADEQAAILAEKLKGRPPEERLKAFIVEKTRVIAKYGPDLCAVTMTACFKHHRDDTFDFHRAAYGYFMRAIEDGMRSGVFRSDLNLYSVTSALRYIVCGLTTHWAIQSSDFDVVAEAERLGEQFIAMLKPYHQ